MPRLTAFYGIVIWMYRPDPPPPHLHAQYGERVAQIEIDGLLVLNGSLPPRALRLVVNKRGCTTMSWPTTGTLHKPWSRWSDRAAALA